MAVALVLVIVYGVAQVLSGDERTGTDALRDETGSSATATGSAAPTTSPTPSPDNSAVAQAPRDKVTVQVRARGTSWVQATTASGEELFQGLLEDQTRTFTDRQRVKLIIGNAGAVTLTVNGTPIGAPGEDGQVARVQFTPQDPAAS
jgi:cytoskeletal protein RodZ